MNNNFLYLPFDKVLSSLARRINPDLEYDSDMHWIDITINANGEFISVCRICGKDIALSLNCDNDILHGIAHLKEYSLLSLI